MNVVDEHCDIEKQKEILEALGTKARLVDLTCHVIACAGLSDTIHNTFELHNHAEILDRLNKIILSNSQQDTRLSLLSIANEIVFKNNDKKFYEKTKILIENLPPLLLIKAPGDSVISED